MRARSRTRPGRRDGSSAVEFALIAFPFFFMIFLVLEIGLLFVTDSVLDNAAMETGRLVRTGQADNANMTKAEFKTALCSRMSVFSTGCADRTEIDVQTITSFRTPPADPTAGGTVPDDTNTVWDHGAAGSLVVVRVWYRQPLLSPFLAQAVENVDDRITLLTATVAFRNEPY